MSNYTTIGQWVTCEITGSRGVARRPAEITHKLAPPLAAGYERVEVLVIHPQGHHKLHQFVIWDVRARGAKKRSALDQF